MKYGRRFAGITILLISIGMCIGLFQYQMDEEASFLPSQVEYFFNEGWQMRSPDGEEAEETGLPFTGMLRDTVFFENTLPAEYAGQTMRFSTVNADVRVLADGREIYRQEAGKDSGESGHSVDIPDLLLDGGVRIELTGSDPDEESALFDMAVARNAVVIGLVGSNLADVACCLLIVIIAIVMLVLALIRRYTGRPDRGEMILAWFGCTAGVYCFIGTDTLSIFYNLQEAYVMQGYLAMMLPVLLALYFERNLRLMYPRRFARLLYCAAANAGIQLALQFAGIMALDDMAGLSAAVMIAVCAAAAVSLARTESGAGGRTARLAALSMLVLLSGELAYLALDICLADDYGKMAEHYGITLSGLMMAVLHIFRLAEEYRSDTEERMQKAREQNELLAQAKMDAEAARQEAMAANEAKGKFLARMSHEIRTPINAVLGMDEMILRESGEPHIREYAMDICTAGQSLLSLINDILDFSKIESGKMEIVPAEYDISSLIHDLVNMASQRAKDKNIRLEAEVDPALPSRLYGDDVRIRQVLTNILTNAVKYTHEGTVWLRVQGRRAENNAVLRFEVEDTGIGIREEDLPKLSAEFERIEEDRNRNIEGTGLGMSITIQLLALLGSRMQVESVYGKGSKFCFELEQAILDGTPVGDFASRVRENAESYCYHAGFIAPDARILAVDDNAVNRKVLRSLLKETQVQVTEAGGGAECLRLVQEQRFDLIFLDHMMPEMDGVETLRRIRALPGEPCKGTPIIALTANAVSGARERYLAEGFDDFLSKPIAPAKLEQMVKQYLPKDCLSAPESGTGEDGSQARTAPLGQAEGGPQGRLEELPFVEGLDWDYAWLHLPDMGLLQYTLKEFYTQIDPAADRLEQAYAGAAEPDCLEAYRIQAHAMKSLAATVGIAPLSGVARVLEYAAKDGKIDVITAVTPIFLEEWRSYRRKLQGVLGIGAAQEKKAADYPVIRGLVEMIRLSMEEMDIDQADPLANELLAYEYPEEIGQNVRMLAAAVANLDPEETDRLAAVLAGQMAGTDAVPENGPLPDRT
ncbi:response regulator [Clostridiaceae bacterium]|nr:response regulator [Clostridiaceae bacterium]